MRRISPPSGETLPTRARNWLSNAPLLERVLVLGAATVAVGATALIANRDDTERAHQFSGRAPIVTQPLGDTESFPVDSADGSIQCYDIKHVKVEAGDTVGSIVARETARIVPAQSLVKPSLDPIVDQVLVNNEILDETKVPVDFDLEIPVVCEFYGR